MKKYALLFLFITTFSVVAQKTSEIAKTAVKIEMLFPEGKTKALLLSYDDGTIHDRKLVKLMNKYHLIGTFHLNSNKLGTDIYFDYLNKAEIKQLYEGH